MIDDECSWQGVIDFYAAYKHLDTFRVAGDVTDQAGTAVPYPVVVIYRGTTLYGWVMGDKAGHYTADLPDEASAAPYHLQVEKSGTTAGSRAPTSPPPPSQPGRWTSRLGTTLSL